MLGTFGFATTVIYELLSHISVSGHVSFDRQINLHSKKDLSDSWVQTRGILEDFRNRNQRSSFRKTICKIWVSTTIELHYSDFLRYVRYTKVAPVALCYWSKTATLCYAKVALQSVQLFPWHIFVQLSSSRICQSLVSFSTLLAWKSQLLRCGRLEQFQAKRKFLPQPAGVTFLSEQQKSW